MPYGKPAIHFEPLKIYCKTASGVPEAFDRLLP